jgi:hypothetical protein
MSKGTSESDKALQVAHASLRRSEMPVLQVQQEEAIQVNKVCRTRSCLRQYRDMNLNRLGTLPVPTTSRDS